MQATRGQKLLTVSMLSVLTVSGILWLLMPAPPRRPPAPLAPPTLALPRPTVPMPQGTDPDSVALRQAIHNGERIYQGLCAHCHGHYGKGDRNDYMDRMGHKPMDHTDLHAIQQLSDEEFLRILRDGVKDKRGWLTMPPWSSLLTTSEMWDVMQYVRRLSAVPGEPHVP